MDSPDLSNLCERLRGANHKLFVGHTRVLPEMDITTSVAWHFGEHSPRRCLYCCSRSVSMAFAKETRLQFSGCSLRVSLQLLALAKLHWVEGVRFRPVKSGDFYKRA